MIGKLIRPTWVTRQDLRDNPETLYLFGDNMLRQGMGGQAGAMRGEPNAVGVPTKWAPGMNNEDFFTDAVVTSPGFAQEHINRAFEQAVAHLMLGQDVAIPADGLGTGLSELPSRAPAVLKAIDDWISWLQVLAEQS